jgi:sulfur carrier protein
MQPARQTAMRITVNGAPREVRAPLTVQQLLAELSVQTHSGLAVLRNGDVVRRADWPRTPVRAEDQLEIVRATVGG